MRRRIYVLLLISLVIITIAFSLYFFSISQVTIMNFKANYYARHTSSAGDRVLDITYTVLQGNIVDCEGTYSSPATTEQMEQGIFENVENCDLNKLINKEYNVPLELVAYLTKGSKLTKEITDGPSYYRYNIIK